MQKMRSLFVGLLMTITVTGFSQQLKINVKTGDKYKVQTVLNATSSASVMGQTMESTIDQKNNTTYEIAAIAADSIDLKSTMTKLDIKSASMGQEMNFDSEKDDNSGPLADMFKPLMNKTRNLTIDLKGNILKQDVDEIGEILTSLSGGVVSNTASIDLFIPGFIGRDLKTGDSFSDSSSVTEEKISSKISGTYIIKSIEKGIATISYTGTQVQSMSMELMGMAMMNNSTNKLSSEIQVDIETGLMLEKTSVVESSINIETAGMSIPGTAKSTLTIKVSKK